MNKKNDKNKNKQALALVGSAWLAIISVAIVVFAAPLSRAQPANPAATSGATSGNPSSATPGPSRRSDQLPNLGDGSDMTTSAERRMGDRIAREIYRDPDYIDDPVLAEYVQGIWQPLLAAARLRGELNAELDERFAWEIMMGKDRSVNAFALPGGYFGLHLGLVAIVTSRDELASVLGHELSHVTQRHISRLIAKQSAQAPWMIGAMILGALAASKSPNAANALIVGGQAVAAQNQLNFSRDMEREADRIGFGVMTQAGFEPYGFVSMFEKLQQASRLNDNGSFPYLRSHPLTTERISDMQARVPLGPRTGLQRGAEPGAPPGMAGTPAPMGKPGTPGTVAPGEDMEQAMIAARANVLSNPGVDALRAWGPLAASPGLGSQAPARQAAALYGATLAAIRLRDLPGALALQARLAAVVQADTPAAKTAQSDARAARLAHLLAAEVALAANDASKAVALMESKNALPGRPEMMLLSQALVRTGQASQAGLAVQQLQTWVANNPRDAQAWQLLSSAYAAQGQSLRAIRADAEAQVAHLDYAGALDRFKAAQELARDLSRRGNADHIEASIIDARARQTALLLKEQSVER